MRADTVARVTPMASFILAASGSSALRVILVVKTSITAPKHEIIESTVHQGIYFLNANLLSSADRAGLAARITSVFAALVKSTLNVNDSEFAANIKAAAMPNLPICLICCATANTFARFLVIAYANVDAE